MKNQSAIMAKNDYTTLQWIWFWGVVTFIFAWLTEETMNHWIFGATMFTALVLFVTTVRAVVKANRRKRIKRKLAVFLQHGDNIRVKCSNQQQPSPDKEAYEWAKEVATYLTKELGEDYSARFYNSDGLPLAATYLSGEHRMIESYVRFRIARLHQFLSELNR